MGLLDGLAGQVVGKVLGAGANGAGGAGGASGMLGLAQALISESGGLSGLLQKFQQAGFAEQVTSWLGSGQNLPISAEQVVAALGSGTLSKLASQFGVADDQVSGGLAKILPNLVDGLTPDGQVSDSSSPLSLELDKLGGLLGGLLK